MSLRVSLSNKIKSLENSFEVYNKIFISRSALLYNFDLLSKFIPNGFVIPVLKSNAYGHGLYQIAEILKDRDFPYIAVDGYYEALHIHEISKQPILVMGAIKSINYSKIKSKNCAFVVHDIDSIKAMGLTNKKFVVHIELETGMGRHGVKISELDDFLNELKKYPNLYVEGVMSHLADADNPKSIKYTKEQTKKFDIGTEKIINAGFKPKYIHLAQSSGCVKVNSIYANTIRLGIALYGISPLEKSDYYYNKLCNLKPTLKLVSTVSKIFELNTNESVSYGRIFIAKKKSRIGVLPIGYYEGIPRALSNIGKVKYNKSYLPIAGRICMNHTMIDVTDSKIKANDEVLIISNNPTDKNSVKNICKNNKLFSYWLLANLNQNIRREIIN